MYNTNKQLKIKTMGDYLENGTKIGTTGNAYYTTLDALKKHRGENSTVDAYLNPKNCCSFAFPFPEYDGKGVGEISNFHHGERVDFIVTLPKDKINGQSFHGSITHHVHPTGAAGLNLFFDCPHEENANVRTSAGFDNTVEKFYLRTQTYVGGKLHVAGECIYCGTVNVFDDSEAIYIAEQLKKRSDKLKAQTTNMSLDKQNELLEESVRLIVIANRILETYAD